MLIQSHTGTVKIFPAIPDSWRNVSFQRLRTVGAFLVSAEMVDGEVKEVDIFSETGGGFTMENPFSGAFDTEGDIDLIVVGEKITVNLTEGQKLILTAK
jgi:alpha-L-fucosidase 2